MHAICQLWGQLCGPQRQRTYSQMSWYCLPKESLMGSRLARSVCSRTFGGRFVFREKRHSCNPSRRIAWSKALAWESEPDLRARSSRRHSSRRPMRFVEVPRSTTTSSVAGARWSLSFAPCNSTSSKAGRSPFPLETTFPTGSSCYPSVSSRRDWSGRSIGITSISLERIIPTSRSTGPTSYPHSSTPSAKSRLEDVGLQP